ncbi:MAG: hypothetical protein EXS36_16745 [Pedosphaera sp.]|nr:hypothetical protein [Pedosphaera sp.]
MNLRNRRISTAALMLLVFVCGQAADAFILDWISIDGGGGPARGANFELNATVGQPDAGEARGGPFPLRAGFWLGLASVPAVAKPVLSAGRIGELLVLAWPMSAGAFTLERSRNLADPSLWQTLPVTPQSVGNEFQVTLPRKTIAAFFRLRAAANP